MFSFLYTSFIFNPLYNGLIFLMDLLPWIDAGVAVIIFTIIVRLILFPLSKKAVITQLMMKKIEPEINKIKTTMANDRNGQALKMMALYKEKGISPFSSFIFLLIQLPIIFALYSIFINSGLPKVNASILYGFIHIPTVNMNFLGILDISAASTTMAVIAAISQYLQLHFSINAPKTSIGGMNMNKQADITQNMMGNMKYVIPVMVFLISYKYSAVVALYWTVSSLFTLAQEIYIKRSLQV